ncbi:MAG TPA: hypothetical protein VFP78_05765, partial [Solirubrobacteraceae bacterium]|nr:hypothetical protein [Solirubrobacteraceae bacterium]
MDSRSDLPDVNGAIPLAEAKLAAPRPHAHGTVPRPRLSAALDRGAGMPLTLVAAPAGYGKTTAVRDWCGSRRAPVAWISLDAGDNDPVRLWLYVATAVDRVREGLGRLALQRLRATGGGIQHGVDELMNGIAAFGDELVVVLDDVQAVDNPDCLGSLDYAVEHLPPNARVIAISRADPALRLARLRAGGKLHELRAAEFAFSREETRELVVERGRVELGAEEVRSLHERTEGWPAALALATIWLRAVDEPNDAVRDFGGSNRFVADYLTQEVFESVDDDVRAFLLAVCVLGRFTPALCDGVLGRTDSAAMLARLERSNLLISRLEHGGWYRIHPLFAEYGTAQLSAIEPDALAQIHRRAGLWLSERSFTVEAAHHAAAAGDHELVARLMVEHHLELIRAGSARTLLRWVGTLPDDLVVAHPELAVGAATAAAMIGQSAVEQRRYLRLADRAAAERPEHVTPYVRAVAAMVRAASAVGGVGRAVMEGRSAVELAQAEADPVLVAARASLARALYLAGELDGAWTAGMDAIEHPDAEHRPPGHAFARSTLALV